MEDAVQLAFDFEEFEREDARARLHEWAGAPLHFTTDYYPPAMLVCEPCDWHSVAGSENQAVEAWHDHAMPGWRNLPVIPQAVRVRSEKGLTKVALQWIEQRYPEAMQVPGAPIITERGTGGTRHVPGYSPWGGYDLSATALGRPAAKPARSAVKRPPAEFAPPDEPGRSTTRGGLTLGG